MRRPEAVLAAGVVFALGWEVLLWSGPFAEGQSTGSAWWYLPPAAVTLGTLVWAHRRRDAVRGTTVVALAAGLALGLLAVHLTVGGPRDQDILLLYPELGRRLLDTGSLPPAEYPPLAIVTFAAATLLGSVRLTLPLLILPLVLLAWWRLAGISPRAPWLVACVALVPTVVVFWEIKYDALPTALLVLGLVAAHGRRWSASGLWLGLGAAAKWFPGLAVPVLAVALLARRRTREAAALVGASAAGFLVVHLPFVGQVDALLAPYRFHAGRGVTGESLPYLPLRLFGLADAPDRPWGEAAVPAWAPDVALVVVVLALTALVVAAAARPRRAVALAAAAPVVFLLGNRIFSPQFVLPVAAAWVAGMVLTRGRGEVRELALAGLVVVVATANFAVWPVASDAWLALEWILFGGAVTATVLASSSTSPLARPGGS